MILALVITCFVYSLYRIVTYAARENFKFSLPWAKGAYFEIIPPPPPTPPLPPTPPCPPPCCVSPTPVPTPTSPPTEEPSPTPTESSLPTPTPTPTPTETPSIGGAPFQFGGPPPPPPVTGQVLGVSTLAGTGVVQDTLFNLIFILGCLATSLGIRKIAAAKV